MENVTDVVVFGEPHALTGQIVTATIRLGRPESSDEFKVRMRRFCAERLAPFKLPAKIRVVTEPIHSARFKRVRQHEPIRA